MRTQYDECALQYSDFWRCNIIWFYDFIKDNTIKTYVTSLENAKPYHTISYPKRTMIILGNEGNGVSREIIEMCDQAITIPMYGDIESLNVSIAAALCMYKVREQI